jgi:uncharacterized protein (DUF1810 family)
MESVAKLDRFRTAQDDLDSGFKSALEEIRTGRKRGHWIWYVFPQLSGLGGSSASRTYAITGVAEATDYVHDPELRSRLLTITTAVAEQLKSERGTSLANVMGSEIDARKLVSSLTLFGHVARTLHADEGLRVYADLADIADEVLAVAARQGYAPCRYTLEHLHD